MLRLSDHEEDQSSTLSRTQPEGSGWSLGGPRCLLSLNVINGESGDWTSLRLILTKVCVSCTKCEQWRLEAVCLCSGFFRLCLDAHPFNIFKHQCEQSWRRLPKQTSSEAGKRERENRVSRKGRPGEYSVVNLCFLTGRKESRLLRGNKIREIAVLIKMISKIIFNTSKECPLFMACQGDHSQFFIWRFSTYWGFYFICSHLLYLFL